MWHGSSGQSPEHFQRVVRTSPNAYRRAFCHVDPSQARLATALAGHAVDIGS